MPYAYYPGCTLKQSAFPLDRQSRKVLQALGHELIEIPDWNCCGATSASKLDDLLEVAMPARNIGIAESEGFREMLIPCSACYSKTVVAKARMESDPELKQRINSELSRPVRGEIRIASILDPLYDAARSGDLVRSVSKELHGLVPACYYGCMLTRFPLDVDLRDNPENPRFMEAILEAMGASCLDWNEKTFCCGASAAVHDQEAVLDLMGRIFSDALARGANCLVTLCPVCQMNLDAYQEQYCARLGTSQRLPVLFITELVGHALGLGYKELCLDRHFVDPGPLFRRITKQMEAESSS